MKKSLGVMAAIMVVAILAVTFIAAKSSTAGEKSRDSRFIAYDDGTVLDTETNLMWAEKDNGVPIDWWNAKSYCEEYRAGGYTDWRMPTLPELAGLYNSGGRYKATQMNYTVRLTEMIQLSSCCVWSSATRDSNAANFGFGYGREHWVSQTYDGKRRALPVRSAK